MRGQGLRAVAPITRAGPIAPTWPVGVGHLPVPIARRLEAPQSGQAGHFIALGALTAVLVLVHGTAPRGSDPPAHASFHAAAATAGLPGTLTLLGPGRGGHPWGRPGGAGPGAGRASRGLCPHAAPHPRLPLQHWRLRVARRGSWAEAQRQRRSGSPGRGWMQRGPLLLWSPGWI